MTCNPTLAKGHGYIIVVVDYFTKWVEAMPTLNNSGEAAVVFSFNHVVAWFGVPQAIVTDHGLHFHDHMMAEFTTKLGLSHDSSTPYYPQANGQAKAINKVLKRMLQRMIGVHKRNWHLIIYSALWAYRTSVRNATGFTPFKLVYEEARFLELIHLDEAYRDAILANEAHKKRIKAQYDRNVKPHIFSEGDMVLLYDQEVDKLGAEKFKPMWIGPYVAKRVLAKGAYELVDYDGIPLSQPRNGLYLRCYYA
eukprot:PITA_12604